MIDACGQLKLRPAVVLVAERTLSGAYKTLFEGIFATMQSTQVPELIMRRFLSPPIGVDRQGRAKAAVLGLRRLESSLLANTSLTKEDVVCTTPEALPRLLGPWTKIVAVSSSDPLGRGMSNTTTMNFWKGELYTRSWTRRLTETISEARKKYDFKVVAGGAGAWQWIQDPQERASQGIDTVFEGYFERQGPGLFADLIDGKTIAAEVSEGGTACKAIEPIRGVSVLGSIELSRGCGKGCRFCLMSDRKMEHVPVATILTDLDANLAGGVSSVVSTSEDFFRYGGAGSKVDFERLRGLLVEMKRLRRLSFMQIDHANVSSVLQFTDDQLKEIRRLLAWERPSDYLWVNMGAESANGRLVHANAPGKIAPFRADDWEDMVRQAADKMTACGFYCVFSIILGLPGETPQDVDRTLKLVEYLASRRGVIFPIFYEPIPDRGIIRDRRFDLSQMRADHLALFSRCYEINFKRVPKLFWDNQRAAGVSWLKRATMQMLGKTEVWSWRRTFSRVGKQIASGTNRPAGKARAVSAVTEEC